VRSRWRNTPRVLYAGDSIAVETKAVVGRVLRDLDEEVVYSAVSYAGVALCDFLDGRAHNSWVPEEHTLPALVTSLQPHVVVLQFWGNSWLFTPRTRGVAPGSEEYYKTYKSDAYGADAQISRAAHDADLPRPKIIWVLQGPDRLMPERVRRLNEDVYAPVAADGGGLLSDAGALVSMAAYPYDDQPRDRYAWTRFLPCTEIDHVYGMCAGRHRRSGLVRLHRDDDDVHFDLAPPAEPGSSVPPSRPSPGAVRFGYAVAQSITAYLDLLDTREAAHLSQPPGIPGR
jgi:hypothetical protein